jgi:hypothetical protein
VSERARERERERERKRLKEKGYLSRSYHTQFLKNALACGAYLLA